jgi:hypothetical protein
MAYAWSEEPVGVLKQGTIFAQASAQNIVDGIVDLAKKKPEWKIEKTGTNTFRCNATLSDELAGLEKEYHCRFAFYDWQLGMQAISVHPILFKLL